MLFLSENELSPTVSTSKVEKLSQENEQSEISLSRIIDVNTCVLENEISSGSDSHSQILKFFSWYPHC